MKVDFTDNQLKNLAIFLNDRVTVKGIQESAALIELAQLINQAGVIQPDANNKRSIKTKTFGQKKGKA